MHIFAAVLFVIWTTTGIGWMYAAFRDDRPELGGLGACNLAIAGLILKVVG